VPPRQPGNCRAHRAAFVGKASKSDDRRFEWVYRRIQNTMRARDDAMVKMKEDEESTCASACAVEATRLLGIYQTPPSFVRGRAGSATAPAAAAAAALLLFARLIRLRAAGSFWTSWKMWIARK
jgi:hypothetical protein